MGANFLLKGSPLLLQDLREVMLSDFGFGDFVFRRPDGSEAGRAADLRQLEQALGSVPEESMVHHAERNHFSRWLKARTEFALAHELRPRRLADYGSPQGLRQSLIRSIADYRRDQSRTLVSDFDRASFDLSSDFYRMGGGSLGGKARGLAFVRRLLAEQGLRDRFAGVEIAVPVTAVLATDVFDRFLDDNELRHFAIECEDDGQILERFQAARFPEEARRDVAAFLERARWPLAVRSSSLLEDSQHQPFTGVYDTLMLANNAPRLDERIGHALAAIKRVYASTFSRHAKAYLKATAYRLEEEKMAVILQRIVGAAHGPRFYPDFAGVARSRNFYPAPPMAADDGHRGGGARDGSGGGRGRRVPALLSAPSPPRPAALGARPCPGDDAARVLGASARRLRRRGEPCARRASGSRQPKPTARSGRWPRPTRPRTRRSTTASRAPGPRLVTFAGILKHGLFPLPDARRDADAGGRARDGHAGRDRVCREPGAGRQKTGASSGSCRCGRSP